MSAGRPLHVLLLPDGLSLVKPTLLVHPEKGLMTSFQVGNEILLPHLGLRSLKTFDSWSWCGNCSLWRLYSLLCHWYLTVPQGDAWGVCYPPTVKTESNGTKKENTAHGWET